MTSATILDPRFKATCFRDTTSRVSAIEKLRKELSELSVKNNLSQKDNEILERPAKRRKENDEDEEFWQFRDEQQAEDDEAHNNYSIELDNYLKEKVLPASSDILVKWDEYKHVYPHLYELHFKYLCIPATSTASERVFSKAGEIVSSKRSRIKPKNVNELIFLNKNFDKLN